MTTPFPEVCMQVYGLTGSIASGKSAVAEMLQPHWPVIDADQVSRDVVRLGSEGLAAVVEAFGEGILLPDGALDRKQLRLLIASDETLRKRLNDLMHPRIAMEIKRRLDELSAQGHELVIVSAALMLETGSYRSYDKVILVISPFEARLQRLLARDEMDEASARNLMAKQMPDEQKRSFTDLVIENDGTLAQLGERTWRLMATLGWSRPGNFT